MTRYRRWPSYQAWRLLRRSPPRVRDLVLPYFEQSGVGLTLDDVRTEMERAKADIYEEHLTEAWVAIHGKPRS